MGIWKVTRYAVECDGCGRVWGRDGEGMDETDTDPTSMEARVMNSADPANEKEISFDERWRVSAGVHYCPDCKKKLEEATNKPNREKRDHGG